MQLYIIWKIAYSWHLAIGLKEGVRNKHRKFALQSRTLCYSKTFLSRIILNKCLRLNLLVCFKVEVALCVECDRWWISTSPAAYFYKEVACWEIRNLFLFTPTIHVVRNHVGYGHTCLSGSLLIANNFVFCRWTLVIGQPSWWCNGKGGVHIYNATRQCY